MAPLEPELDHLRGRPMEPGLLLPQLARSGIVITPTAGDAAAGSTVPTGGAGVAAAAATAGDDAAAAAAGHPAPAT